MLFWLNKPTLQSMRTITFCQLHFYSLNESIFNQQLLLSFQAEFNFNFYGTLASNTWTGSMNNGPGCLRDMESSLRL